MLVVSNTKYVSQVIHEVYGSSFNAFVNGYRVNLARERLTNVSEYGNYTIKVIGESLGFKSQTSFTNIFRRATGITPAMYQKIASEDTSTQR
ncbi:MAG: helix-turn-helix domain-containing protein [Prevotella sp.]|nr:helix-turn-helix domain-containing protein [Prevotella sp.]